MSSNDTVLPWDILIHIFKMDIRVLMLPIHSRVRIVFKKSEHWDIIQHGWTMDDIFEDAQYKNDHQLVNFIKNIKPDYYNIRRENSTKLCLCQGREQFKDLFYSKSLYFWVNEYKYVKRQSHLRIMYERFYGSLDPVEEQDNISREGPLCNRVKNSYPLYYKILDIPQMDLIFFERLMIKRSKSDTILDEHLFYPETVQKYDNYLYRLGLRNYKKFFRAKYPPFKDFKDKTTTYNKFLLIGTLVITGILIFNNIKKITRYITGK